jgi:hypothetical protein
MDRFIDPKEHLQTEDIQKQIRSYYSECPEFTNDGKLCRPSFSTNKLTNPYTKKKVDCNWYCLRNCSPQKLLPIFKNIPKYIIEKDETKIPINNAVFTFKPWESLPTFRIIVWVREPRWGPNVLWEWTDYRHYSKEISEDTLWESKGLDLNILAEQVCQWFKSQNSNMDISLECELRAASQNFSRFDMPFLRPVSEWHNNGIGVVTQFTINKSVPLQIQERKNELPASPWENLPIGLLGEKDEPLSSYGVAHPDIHRVSRKHRKASHHRPRHFHSPTRKEVVGRKLRHRK